MAALQQLLSRLLGCAIFLLASLAVASSQSLPSASSGLAYGYYSTSCPTAEQVVAQLVQSFLSSDISQAGGIVRLLFHDCFVQGCDASLLVRATGGELDAPPNASLRAAALALMDQIKQSLESACPNTVSCADIIAIAGSAAVQQAGGPTFQVPTGRLDSLDFTNNVTTTQLLPSFTETVSQLISTFSNLNLDTTDLVALSGAHTFGIAHCSAFAATSTSPPLTSSLAQSLQSVCPNGVGSSGTTNLDVGTPTTFDNTYFTNILNSEGLLQSDRALLNDTTSAAAVQSYAGSQSTFFSQFAASFVKMSMVGVQTVSNGNNGNIRTVCSQLNAATMNTTNTTASSLTMLYTASDTVYKRQ